MKHVYFAMAFYKGDAGKGKQTPYYVFKSKELATLFLEQWVRVDVDKAMKFEWVQDGPFMSWNCEGDTVSLRVTANPVFTSVENALASFDARAPKE